MRKKLAHIFAALFLSLLFAAAGAAQDFFAAITEVAGNRVTVNAGADAELEVGDILVVQSAGRKKGLVRVLTTNRDSAVAETFRLEAGASFARGDIAAYQLLQTNPSLWSANPTQRETRESAPPARRDEEFPPWMGEHRPAVYDANPQQPASRSFPDLDANIAKQKDILIQSPADRRAMYTLADLYFQKGWYDQSIVWNQRAVEADANAADNDKMLHQIAAAYTQLGDREKYEIYMDYIRKRYPDSVFAYEYTGGSRYAPAASEPRMIGDKAWTLNPSSMSVHEATEPVKLGVGATIKKRLDAGRMEVRKGKMKIIPIRKSKSEKTDE